jgi:hypothetical protein
VVGPDFAQGGLKKERICQIRGEFELWVNRYFALVVEDDTGESNFRLRGRRYVCTDMMFVKDDGADNWDRKVEHLHLGQGKVNK